MTRYSFSTSFLNTELARFILLVSIIFNNCAKDENPLEPDDNGNIENNYFIHVLETTADFSRENKFTAWLTGGLNLHVVHHLFPQINHVHYIPLTHIIRQMAEEFGMQYQENPNFWVALKLHMKMLKHLSKKDAVVPQYGLSAALT